GAIFIGEPSLEWIIQPQIRLPILSAESSAPVSTASTPGSAFAAFASIDLMRACACGERTNTARVSPGRLTGSCHCPLPVMKRKSSLRPPAAPIPVALMACPPTIVSDLSWFGFRRLLGGLPRASAASHVLRARRDGFDDVVIAGAAAQVAFQLLADGLVVEVVAFTVDHVDRGHDHAWRAEAALKTVMLAERRLHRMQFGRARGQAFDRQHVGTVRRQRQHRAGL